MKKNEPSSSMWKHYLIEHKTEYCYAYAVNHARHRAHLVPLERNDQKLHRAKIVVNQPLSETNSGIDFFGNRYQDFAISKSHRLLNVHSSLHVMVRSPRLPEVDTIWAGHGFNRRDFNPSDKNGTKFAVDCALYMVESQLIKNSPEITSWVKQFLRVGAPLYSQLLEFAKVIHDEFVFDPQATTVTTRPLDIFKNKRGVCQDFSHLMIAALRSIGIPTRYVSGYILTHPPVGSPRLIGADATHAWVEAWCPEFGWIGLDPTNGKAVSDEFVALAYGRDYADVVPLRGVIYGGGEHTLDVSVTMMPLDESKIESDECDIK